MSALQSDQYEGTDPDYHLGSHGIPRLGVDRRGRSHYLDVDNGRILVANHGEVIHVADLHSREPTDWVAFIAEKSCGWKTHGSSQMLDALAGAFNPGEVE